MATSTRAQIKKILIEEISASEALRADLEAVPDRVAETVRALMPVDTGEAKASLEVKARRTPYKRLSTRKIKIGTVLSDDDPLKVQSIEFGRGPDDDNGPTPEFAPFRRAAALWNDKKLQ